MLIHLQTVLSVFVALLLFGLPSQSFSLFQSGRERPSEGLRQHQREHSDDEGQDSYNELLKGEGA